MHNATFVLISGQTGVVSQSIEVIGMETFTVGFIGSGNTFPATGTMTLNARLNPYLPYNLLYITGIVANTAAAYYQFSGPYESLQTNLSGTNGTFSAVCLAGYHAN